MSIIDSPPGHGRGARGSTQVPQQPAALATTPALSQETLELLAWVAQQPRTYAEAMAVWQTSCPRHSVWEDAMADALIEVANGRGKPMEETTVLLTRRGQAALGDA